MNILIVSHEYPPIGGGGANACMNLAREYDKLGHNVDIVTAWYCEEKEVEEQGNITIYRVKSKRKKVEQCSFGEMFDYILKARPLIDKIERDTRHDICQVFFGVPAGPIGLYLKMRYGIPYVIRFGGGDIPGFQNRYLKLYKFLGPTIRMVWKNADALVANSSGLKSMAEEFYDKKEIMVITNGADIHPKKLAETEEPKESELESSGNIERVINLLFVSRLIERKGLQDVLTQIRSVVDQCKKAEINVFLHVVGDGWYRESLAKIVDEEGLNDIVVFHGQEPKENLAKYYEDADIFIFPSRKEGMPNVVLEAMSYGLPIIMTPCGGSKELIDGNGYIADASEFGVKTMELIKNEKLREVFGKKSRMMVAEKLNWENSAMEYERLFERIV